MLVGVCMCVLRIYCLPIGILYWAVGGGGNRVALVTAQNFPGPGLFTTTGIFHFIPLFIPYHMNFNVGSWGINVQSHV
jgi:hypothetical protein